MVNVDEAFELRYWKGKEEFQVLVDFDELQKFRKKPEEISVYDVLADTKIYRDQKKGDIASENLLKTAFEGKEEEAILKEMLLEGECQIPTSYLNKLREEKKEQTINYITSNSINPGTKSRYTRVMIETEVNRLNYNFNAQKDHISQAEEVLKLLKKKMPIRMDKTYIEISIPGQYCGAFYGPFRKYGKISKEFYDQAGNLRMHMEVTSGVLEDVISFIKKNTNNEASYHVTNISE